MQKLLMFTASVAVLLLALFIGALTLSKIDPISFEPDPNAGLEGAFAPNTLLADVERLLDGVGTGPEDIAVGPDGALYTGYRDGRIVRFTPAGEYEIVADTGGAPLGLRVASDGALIVADGLRGLLRIAADGSETVLVGPDRLTFVDGVDIAADGTIWLTDASSRFRYGESMYIFLEGRRDGRLLSYTPSTAQLDVHLEDLFFANGVAVAPAGDHVLVSETAAGQIRRYWLDGEQAGSSDVFIGGLPGAPDNLSIDAQGLLWVGIPGKRDKSFEGLADRPIIRRVIGALPAGMLMPPGRFNMIVGIAGDGTVAYNLQNDSGPLDKITSALRLGDVLYIGSLGSDAVGVLPLPAGTALIDTAE